MATDSTFRLLSKQSPEATHTAWWTGGGIAYMKRRHTPRWSEK